MVMLDIDGANVYDESESVAKEENGKFYIRFYGSGYMGGSLLDVKITKINLDKKSTMKDGPAFPFCQVSKECFDEYVEFLRTKNIGRLSLAERLRNEFK